LTRYNVSVTNVTVTNLSVTLTTQLNPPQMRGTTINWTATPTGGVAPYQYKWWLSDGVSSSVLANWSANNTLAWTPADANTRYVIAVGVKSGGNSAETAEATQQTAFAIIGGVPTITGIQPAQSNGGTTSDAVISGTNLSEATAVTFSGSGVTATIGPDGTATSLPVTITIDAGAAASMRTVTIATPLAESAPFT